MDFISMLAFWLSLDIAQVLLIIFLSYSFILKQLYASRFNEADRGYTGFNLSVSPSLRPSVCPSMVRIVSILYLEQDLSESFHIYTSY